MQAQEKIFLFTIVLAALLMYSRLKDGFKPENISALLARFNQPERVCPVIKNIDFTITDNKGNDTEDGVNYVIIFDPKSKDLDFKVSLGLSHKLYAKDSEGKLRQNYIYKRFYDFLTDENSTLNGRKPIAAINADYSGAGNKPQGLNISRGVEYSGPFKDKRSSFGISGGKPEERRATIQIGKRQEALLNYNVVGGNGRFYQNGKFKDICKDLGDYLCGQEINRSLAAITSKGYVIFLANNASLKQALYPSMFDNVLEVIAKNYCLGEVQEGILFDSGFSTSLYFEDRIYLENTHPVGSVFLIYKK